MAIACDVQSLENNSRCFVCVSPGIKPVFDISLLVPVAGASTNPQILLVQSSPYQFLGGVTGLASEVYLLALIAGGSTDPSTLANAASCFVCKSGGELADIHDYLYAVIAGGSLNPFDLLPAAAPYQTLFGYEAQVRVFLTNKLAVNLGVYHSTDPKVLANDSRCFLMCMPNFLLQSVKAYLLCQIAAGSMTSPCTAPGAPTNLIATADAGGTSVSLTWSKPAGLSPTSFTIKYGTTPGGPYPNTQNAIILSASVTGLTPNTTYYFVVVSNNNPPANCSSGNSNEASATTPQNGSSLANAWADRVVTNGGVRPGNTSINAYAALWDGLVADGISGMIKHLNGLVNDNNTACITPFIVGVGSDPWVARCGTVFFTSFDLTVNGLKPQAGNTITMDTGVVDTAAFASDNDGGITLYVFTTVSENQSDFGYTNDVLTVTTRQVLNAGGSVSGNLRNQVGSLFVAFPGGTFVGNGYFSFNRIAANDFRLFIANAATPHQQLGGTIAGSLGSRAAVSMYFGGARASDHGATCFDSGGSKRYSFMAIHSGFTTAQSALFFNRIQTFRTSIGGGAV